MSVDQILVGRISWLRLIQFDPSPYVILVSLTATGLEQELRTERLQPNYRSQ